MPAPRCDRRSPCRACETRRLGTPMVCGCSFRSAGRSPDPGSRRQAVGDSVAVGRRRWPTLCADVTAYRPTGEFSPNPPVERSRSPLGRVQGKRPRVRDGGAPHPCTGDYPAIRAPLPLTHAPESYWRGFAPAGRGDRQPSERGRGARTGAEGRGCARPALPRISDKKGTDRRSYQAWGDYPVGTTQLRNGAGAQCVRASASTMNARRASSRGSISSSCW